MLTAHPTPAQAAPLPQLPGPVDQYVSLRIPVCGLADTVEEVLVRLRAGAHDSVADVAVCTEPGTPSRLLGLVPFARMLAAPPGTTAAELLDPDPPVVALGHDSEQAAWKAVRHGESSLAVVDEDGLFHGLVPSSRLLGLLLRAHDEDFARLGGYLASSHTARVAMEEPVTHRLWHRVPWLVLGLAGAALSAWFVGLFEGRLTADVRLAFFIPGVIYLADAVGTQTEALVVRGLSVGTSLRSTIRLEALTGPLLGLLLAAVGYPAILSVLGDPGIALTVSIALVAACSVATVVAAVLPVLMSRTGRDPAFGSGPLATVIQDLLSLVIYFLAAVLVLG
ncbi:magnesium transporter [Nocardioides terrigena]|uniref:magnesium transporter n=1 Tax=Nocardioides terrigena TaxID=424797 RepID=UPI0019010CED|nr:magnesium transporter [Nocardioides terrigena]